MRSAHCIVLGLLLSAAVVVPAADKTKAAKPAPTVNIVKLAWLAGHWRLEKGGRVIDEHWMAPAGGVMLGMGRTVSKGKELEHEFLQIREGPDGVLYYVAQPSGQPEASSTKEITSSQFVPEIAGAWGLGVSEGVAVTACPFPFPFV